MDSCLILVLLTISFVTTGCTIDTVRLVGGDSETEGTVEVCSDQTWGVVASLSWTVEDAQVVCRQLGLPTEGR